jgi:hypothetical protein
VQGRRNLTLRDAELSETLLKLEIELFRLPQELSVGPNVDSQDRRHRRLDRLDR